MKKKVFIQLLSVLLLSFFITSINAQVVNTKTKEYKKAIKERTKDFEKKGYSPKGSGTIEIYVRKAINVEFEVDEDGQAMYSTVYTSALAPSYEAAVNACRASARAALAGNIETNVGELVKRSLNTEQISAKSANGIDAIVTAGKQLIAQKISMEDTYIFYREVMDERDGKTLIEVEYASHYSQKFAMQKAQEFIKAELKEEVEEVHEDLDKIFDLN